MHKERNGQNRLYLRAEPTADGRRLLRAHQKHLAQTCERLRISPRCTATSDLHWTVIFLDSPERWTQALRTAGAETEVSARDLVALAFGNDHQRMNAYAAHADARPVTYDVFFTHGSTAVVVLHLRVVNSRPTEDILNHLRERLLLWEHAGRIPHGMASKLFHHRAFPLARELNGGIPHVTLARGRVSRERQRDVLRSIRGLRLASRDRIPFARAVIRTVGAPSRSHHAV